MILFIKKKYLNMKTNYKPTDIFTWEFTDILTRLRHIFKSQPKNNNAYLMRKTFISSENFKKS